MLKTRIIVLGADHAGYKIKEFLKEILSTLGYEVEDVGTFDETSVDYPEYAEKVALKVSSNKQKLGILACGTGIGASIAANKIPGIRAALVTSEETARLSRQHNDSNILVLGGRPFHEKEVEKIVKAWLAAQFEGGRHQRRINKIADLEKRYHPT